MLSKDCSARGLSWGLSSLSPGHRPWHNEGRLALRVGWQQLLLWLDLSDPSLLLYHQPVGVVVGSAELLPAAGPGSMADGSVVSRVGASRGLCFGPWFFLAHGSCSLHPRAGLEAQLAP